MVEYLTPNVVKATMTAMVFFVLKPQTKLKNKQIRFNPSFDFYISTMRK